MDVQKIIEVAINEIETKQFGYTQQFLEVHDIARENGLPKVIRVKPPVDDVATVFFAVEGEEFFWIAYVNVHSLEVTWVEDAAHHAVYLKVFSKNLNHDELAAMTKLKATGGWNIGDARRGTEALRRNSAFLVEPNPEPEFFEQKLNALLDHLETDRDGIARLKEKGESVFIQVYSAMYNANSMLGGHFLTLPMLKRLTALELEIDFEICAAGNLLKDDDDWQYVDEN